jgi:hypothetical protein
MMHVYQVVVTFNTDEVEIEHVGDCNGSVCPGCGCCIHCAVDCPCEGCDDETCLCGDV